MISCLLKVSLLLTCSGLAHAGCTLHNQMDKPETKQDERGQLCRTTGDDTWTFGMRVSEVVVPTFDADNMWAGHSGTKEFIIYDHNCVPQGVYAPEGPDCGSPYYINDLEGLPYDITVKEINFDPSQPYFRFSYANGDYMISENGAVCADTTGGLRVEKGCRAAFPIEGEKK